MALQTVTLHLPDTIYRRLRELARRADRPVEEETISLLASLLNKADETIASAIEQQLAQLELLTDEELWRAARSEASPDDNELMQELTVKLQREGLTTNEQEQVDALAAHFKQIMLVRAKAALILSERGHDVSTLPIVE